MKHTTATELALAAALVAAAAGTAHGAAHPAARCDTGTVHVVGPAPGAGIDFLSIQAAVNAAQDGDSVLVKPGSYASFGIFGKDVDVIADVGGPVVVAGFAIRSLGASGDVVVRGIDARGGKEEGAKIIDCVGHVWLEDCTFEGAQGDGAFLSTTFDPNGHAGVLVDGSPAVVFTRCELRGGPGDDYVPLTALHGNGGDGLLAIGSNVALHGCRVLGGFGGSVDDDDAAWSGLIGGDGAKIDATFLFAADSEFVGGAGGRGGEDFDPFFGYSCAVGGPGGAGLRQSTPSIAPVDVQLLASTTTGGGGGSPSLGSPCNPGATGPDVEVTSGTVQALVGAAFQFAAASPVREGQSATFDFGGEPGAFAVLAVAAAPTFVFDAGLLGVLLVDPGATLLFPGLLDGNGALSTTLTANLAVGVGNGCSLYSQAVFFSPSTLALVLGPGSALTVLDQSL